MAISLANMTKRERNMVALAALSIALIGAYWYFLYSPKGGELDTLETRVVSLETLNQRARADIAQGSVERLQAEAARDARTLELMRRLVPTSNEVPALLEDISTAARRVGLDVASVEPMPVLPGEDFDTHRYALSVVGDYHAIGRFLSNVGSLSRIVAPVTIEIKPAPAPTGAQRTAGPQRVRARPDRPRLETQFQVQTYVSRAAPAGTVAASAADRGPRS